MYKPMTTRQTFNQLEYYCQWNYLRIRPADRDPTQTGSHQEIEGGRYQAAHSHRTLVESENDMQWRNRYFTSLAANLHLVAALAQSKSTYTIVMNMEQSLMHLASIEQHLQLHVRWDTEQAQRQHRRLMRQHSRLQWQRAMLEQLRRER